ncbi:MAG: ribosome-associated toxin RatA of RatAB toxin-antitoxin module, partial [Cyclobacteriaceae bacterium]
ENLIVDNLETQIEGEWEAITNREEPLLLLEFEVEEGPFEQLEDDWTILSAGDAKVELSSDSDEGTKTLVLEKQ